MRLHTLHNITITCIKRIHYIKSKTKHNNCKFIWYFILIKAKIKSMQSAVELVREKISMPDIALMMCFGAGKKVVIC